MKEMANNLLLVTELPSADTFDNAGKKIYIDGCRVTQYVNFAFQEKHQK